MMSLRRHYGTPLKPNIRLTRRHLPNGHHMVSHVYITQSTFLEGKLVRTQIYLTPEEQNGLRALARQTGLSQSELIRQAVDAMLEGELALDRAARLHQARGLWSARTDLPDFGSLRRELDHSDADADAA